MIELNDGNFEKEVGHSKMPVLVDFWAPWCAPCRIVGPILEKISKEYTSKLMFAKLNVDESQELASRHDVRGIPCMIVFNHGKEIERIVGAFPEPVLRSKLDMALAKN